MLCLLAQQLLQGVSPRLCWRSFCCLCDLWNSLATTHVAPASTTGTKALRGSDDVCLTPTDVSIRHSRRDRVSSATDSDRLALLEVLRILQVGGLRFTYGLLQVGGLIFTHDQRIRDRRTDAVDSKQDANKLRQSLDLSPGFDQGNQVTVCLRQATQCLAAHNEIAST